MIGYVPQQINLVDDTIAANIALGLESKDINNEEIEEHLKLQVHDFVIRDLPNKYLTVGEEELDYQGVNANV